MSYGIQVFDSAGTQRLVDNPFWVLDMFNNVNGSGSKTYSFDASLFKIEAIAFCWKYGTTPSFKISGATLTYSNESSLWFFVKLTAV